jgi:hypothetical protein
MRYLNGHQRGDRTVLPKSQTPATMVSYDEGYRGDQTISLESLNIELSSDFEYTSENSSSPSRPEVEVDKVGKNVGCSAMVFEVDNDEEDDSV